MPSFTTATSTTWPVPSNADTTSIQVYATGESGLAGTSAHGSHAGGGSGAGACGGEPALGGLVAGATVLTITVPQGGTGNPTTVTGGSVTVQGNAGGSAAGQTAGAGGTAGSNTIAYAGGAGAAGLAGASANGGGGGGSAGSGGPGGAGSSSTGGSAGTGTVPGAAGASGAGTSANGANGTGPGGGASGGGSGGASNHTGGSGAPGQVVIIWNVITYGAAGTASSAGVMGTAKKAPSGFKGVMSFTGAPLPVTVVNQWQGVFAQPAAFGVFPPALQSSVIALTPANSVGGGSGYPSGGNWLFCIAGWNQSGLPSVTAGDADDTHSFWRPGDVTKSQWAVSPASGNTRTSVWYTANLARAPGDVYVAPDGAMAGRACLVIEIAGLGPWDVVTSIGTGYAAAAMSLGLSLGAPSAPAFILAAACGDLTGAGQALAPAGWTSLASVTASNGADHTCDAVLTSACTVTSGSVSVSATASSGTDLSGVIIGVLTSAPSPVAAGANPAWAGRFIMEMAANGGFQTPADELQWTVVTDNAWLPGQAIKRLWGFSDQSGIPYMLGQLQSGTGAVPLDNFDGALSPARVGPSGPWSFTTTGTPSTGKYFTVTTAQATSISAGQAFTDTSNPGTLFVVSSVGAPSGGLVNVTFAPAATTVMSGGDTVTQVNPVAGIPVRLRCALGTITTREGSVTYDRWYILQRNSLNWPEKRNRALRNFVPLATTDIWSVMSGSCPTPYRGEVEQDLAAYGPGWWWPCDDQALSGGVLPTSLRNAAKGSATVLNIVPAPGGVTGQDNYSSGIGAGAGGVDLTSSGGAAPNQSVAVYAVGAASGAMYGDPQVSPQSAQTGNPVTAQPGFAAWQQTGALGNTGSAGWVLIANDTFPPVANGVTVSGWWNYQFLGGPAGYTSVSIQYEVAQQPYCPLTLLELATGTAPVAILQLDISGHLNLITYNGGTPTSHSIYSTSDLRCNAFLRVTAELTQSSYTVYVNGGLTVTASGSCTISASAWQWLIAGGDLGSNGGSAVGTGLQHGGNVMISGLQVLTGLLPKYRELAQYAAAIDGCGLLPAPTGVQAASVANASPTAFTPDGTQHSGSYATGTSGTSYTISALAAAVAGSYTSGPAARNAIAARGGNTGLAFGAAAWVGWTAFAPLVQVFTSAAAGAETEASGVLGSGESFTSGYGSGATGTGVGHVSGGTGASPPAGPSALGDTVAQRIERILGLAGITAPARAVDASAAEPVQAARDVGGQPPGASLQAMVSSDDGMMFMDNCGVLNYRSRPHLSGDTVTWFIGTNVAAGMIPFDGSITYPGDSQRVYTDITVTPYSPDGASPAIITPSDGAAVSAAQLQSGPKPYAVTSYLQSSAKQQAQADSLFGNYSTGQRRIQFTVNAASHPAAWAFVLGASISDICQVLDTPIGAPATTGNFRITRLERSIAYGANGSTPEATAMVTADPVLTYWS